jgi:hypothetical protein
MMDEKIQFSNMDSWRGSSSGKFGLTFKQIVLMHINRCVQNGSVEFRGGFWQSINKGTYSDSIYIADSRDVFNNSIKMLRVCLLGYFDEKMNKADKELQKEFDEGYKEFSEAEKNEKEVRREWYAFKIDWHIRLFEELIKLSKRLNFFEEESSEEEM